MSKLTPEQAWNHVRALWPNSTHISTDQRFVTSEHKGTYLHFKDRRSGLGVAIDWPEGVDRWPMPEEEWVDAVMPQDWGKQCRHRESETDEWKDGILIGKHTESRRLMFVIELAYGIRVDATCCQVRVEPKQQESKKPQTSKTDPTGLYRVPPEGFPMSIAPQIKYADLLLYMGGEWITGYLGRDRWAGLQTTHAWDEANQPTAWKPL